LKKNQKRKKRKKMVRVVVDRWLPLKFIILLEGFWVFYFAALVFWFQTTELTVGGNNDDILRLALILLAFHAAAPVGLITSMEHKHQKGVPMAPFVWIVMAVFTDFWSTLDIYLHLNKVTVLQVSALAALKGLSTIALILSVAGSLYYGILLAWGQCEKKTMKALLKTHDDFDDEGVTEMKSFDRYTAATNLKTKAQVNIRQSILK
jgi:hypothetical protein